MMQSDILPMRGNDVSAIIMNDHDVIKGLLDNLSAPPSGADRQQILEQLKGALTIHNATEENLIYPAIDKIAGSKFETLKLYNQTASADILLFQLGMALKEGDTAKFDQTCQKLQDAILSHMDEEEKSALPHLQQRADSREEQMLMESIQKFRNSLRFMPEGAAAASRTTTSTMGEVSTSTTQTPTSGRTT